MDSAPDDPIRYDLVDGRQMTVRPTTAADAERIRVLYEGLSDQDRYRRFFGAFRPRAAWCREWATIRERGGYGIIAIVHELDGGESVAGEAGYVLRRDGDGDLAVAVAASWRGWLGPVLLDVLSERAAASGVSNLHADVLLENGPMLAVLRRHDPATLGHDRGVVHLSIGTGGRPASWPPDDERPRVLVGIAGRRWSGEAAAERAGVAVAMCAGPDGRRGGCPVLAGGTCPLADGADAILVLFDPEDERSRRLADAHRRNDPTRPVLVRRSPDPVDSCVDLVERSGLDAGDDPDDPDDPDVIDDVLALLGQSNSALVADDGED